MVDDPENKPADDQDGTVDPHTRSNAAEAVLKAVLQEQWQLAEAGKSVPAEEFFQRYPELLESTERQMDVVYNEFLIRRETESLPAPDAEDYCRRFPHLETELQDQFRLFHCLVTETGGIDDTSESQSDSVTDLSGVTIGDRYELVAKIGAGGVADVYQARDRQLNRQVALKISRTPLETHTKQFRRFLREAEAAASLSHPGIVPVYEFGEFRNRPYIVAQFFDGGTMNRRSAGPLTDHHTLCEWMIRLCDAAQYAHECGVVHRDLKPANILFDTSVHPRITDFGLAALLEHDSTLTEYGDIVGTPAYMAPEQAGGQETGPLSDVYSLGVIMYELLTGQLPFSGTTPSVLHQILHESPPAPSAVNENITRDLEVICLKAMSRLAADRYRTARAMAEDLRRYQDGEPILARPISSVERLSRLARRYPATSVLVLLLVLVSGAAVGGSLQYINVVQQRDRANAAESQIRELLTNDVQVSGQLAFQQGFTQIAADRFREAIDRGHPDPAALRIKIAACELVNGNYQSAYTQFTTALQDNPALADNNEAALLKAQFALAGIGQFGEPLQLLQQIDAESLAEADREYVLGMLSETSPEALTHFIRAVELDNHHHAARRMACILALSLAEFELSASLADIARELFPDDEDFAIVAAVASACLGNSDQATEILDSTTLPPRQKKACRQLIEYLVAFQANNNSGGERVFHRSMSVQDAELTFADLMDVLTEFQSRFLPVLRQRQWMLPPNTEAAFEDFLSAVGESGLLANPAAEGQRAEDRLMNSGIAVVRAHPEGTLSTVIARQLLDWKPTTTQQLLDIQFFYEHAMSADAFLADTRSHAIIGAMMTAAHLDLIEHHESEKNRRRIFELMELLEPQSVPQTETARVLTLLSTNNARWDMAEKFCPRWVELARQEFGEADERLISPLWNEALVYEHNEQWLKVLTMCDRMLAIVPDASQLEAPVDPVGLRNRATFELTGILTEVDGLDWGQVFNVAHERNDRPLAEFAVRQLERNPPVGLDLQALHARLAEMTGDSQE